MRRLASPSSALTNGAAPRTIGMCPHSYPLRIRVIGPFTAPAFVSGSCLRVDGAVPDARRSSPLAGNGANERFNAFLPAQSPKVLGENA